METREKFLNEKDKKIIFHYTPKHASWMNQIEIWFGILMKKAIRLGSFNSKKELKKKIPDFIDYFNKRWRSHSNGRTRARFFKLDLLIGIYAQMY